MRKIFGQKGETNFDRDLAAEEEVRDEAYGAARDARFSKQLLTKVRSFIVTVLSRRLNIRLVLLQPLRHQLISQTEQIPTRI